MAPLLTFAELQQAEELLPSVGGVGYLLAAVSDWPTMNLQEPEQLLVELRAELGEPLTYDALTRYAQDAAEPWKAEAVSSLLLLFEEGPPPANQPLELESILAELTASVRASLQQGKL